MKLWYPEARKPITGLMPTHGTHPKGYPEGAVIHYTAGVQGNSGVEIEHGAKDGYAFMLIGANGDVFQAHPLDRWGYHAGTASWPAFTDSVSKHTVGIEIACAGALQFRPKRFWPITNPAEDEYQTWFGTKVPSNQVRIVTDKDNVHAGAYQIYTAAQEAALVKLLNWLYTNGAGIFSYDNVVGHDEVAPKRKSDPGGSLSWTMPEFRTFLKSQGISVMEEKET